MPKRAEREELRRRVEELHRDHPEWSAREIEVGLKDRAPVAYGNWLDETPLEESRLRAVQRWRGGGAWTSNGSIVRVPFPYLWPLGERQRQEIEPAFVPSRAPSLGSWRIFIYNCGPEVVRDVRILLDGNPVDYAPAILTGRFCEVQWKKVESLRSAVLEDGPDEPSSHQLRVEFVVGRGMKEARLDGVLHFDPKQGWRMFQSGEARATELE